MADTFVSITAGTGTNIDTFTEATNGNHRQCVVVGDPSTTAGVAPVSAANGLAVDVTRVVPGVTATSLGKAEDQPHVDGDTGILILGVRNHFTGSTADGDYAAISVSSYGDLHTISRRDQQRIAVQTTTGQITTATTNYTAGDQIGPIFTFANAARLTGGGGVITGVRLVDAGDVIGAVDVVFFDSSVTLAGDNNPFGISDPDALKVLAIVQLAGAYDIGNNRVCQAFNLAIPYVLSGGTSLFASIITRTANTFFAAATDVQLAVTVDRY